MNTIQTKNNTYAYDLSFKAFQPKRMYKENMYKIIDTMNNATNEISHTQALEERKANVTKFSLIIAKKAVTQFGQKIKTSLLRLYPESEYLKQLAEHVQRLKKAGLDEKYIKNYIISQSDTNIIFELKELFKQQMHNIAKKVLK